MGCRGLGAAKRVVVGSVTEHASKHLQHTPVIAVKPRLARPDGATERRVVIAIDKSDNSHRAFDWALEHVVAVGDVVVLVHCAESAQDAAKGQENTREYFEACKDRGIEAKINFQQNVDPRDGVVDAVEEHQADLLVIGSRGLGPLKRMFLGSVSDYALVHASCPVAIIRGQ
mmetsp:Transcript_50127/g.108940  ORF Transcript_50127/g.108940 Transcript_50127/m.108940 type:complete len:172 (-) Transcript_50127:24-539(-)